jgi:type IV pilus assembly protein PilX
MTHPYTTAAFDRRDKGPARERGVVMVITLIMLLLLSIIGSATMRNVTLEERIAGNMRDHDLAFQAAEAALREGERFVETLVNTSLFNGTGGLYAKGTAPDPFTAWPAGARAYSGTLFGSLAELESAPEYIIEIRSSIEGDPNATLNVTSGYGTSAGTGEVVIFKIHARGTGSTDSSQVILRSNFAKRF